eukprot:COSAG03_NODE_606_length_6737_cov_3.303163_4_plen_157_part_00
MMVASVPRATSSLIFGEHEQRHSRKHPWTGPPTVRASKSDKTERETEREGDREGGRQRERETERERRGRNRAFHLEHCVLCGTNLLGQRRHDISASVSLPLSLSLCLSASPALSLLPNQFGRVLVILQGDDGQPARVFWQHACDLEHSPCGNQRVR